jgi:hypothetical protein
VIPDLDGSAMAAALRERVASFVNDHVDLWVTVDDDGTLLLAGNDASALFRAAAEWLAEPGCTVADVRWERRSREPAYALRLTLRPAADGQALLPEQTRAE